jgi:hypothetical protein
MDTNEVCRQTATELANRLTDQYEREFQVCKKEHVGCEDEHDAPPYVVGFLHDGIFVVDPFSSDCGRFSGNPVLSYGISVRDALAIRQHNKVVVA